MIITKTPYRISFFGGGTDYSEWYRENGGAFLSATINKYIYGIKTLFGNIGLWSFTATDSSVLGDGTSYSYQVGDEQDFNYGISIYPYDINNHDASIQGLEIVKTNAKHRHSRSSEASKAADFDAAGLREWRLFELAESITPLSLLSVAG